MYNLWFKLKKGLCFKYDSQNNCTVSYTCISSQLLNSIGKMRHHNWANELFR